MPETKIHIAGDLFVFEHELQEKFVHSGGPGGQNVNKVATGVQLRFNIRANDTLPTRVADNARKLAGQRLNNEGEIVIHASKFRSQEKNRDDARSRLIALLQEAAKPPPPKRKPTRPTLGARKRRLDSKTRRGATKKLRGRVSPD